jgi:uncharacterized protein
MNDFVSTSIQSKIDAVADAVRGLLCDEKSGHDWQHIFRVWKLAGRLAAEERADAVVVSLAALLHDVDDRKITGDITTEETLVAARSIMAKAGIAPGLAETVCRTIKSMGFHRSLGGDTVRSLEAHIVSDADQLDAIGSIGIARTILYGASKGRKLFDPSETPMENFSKEQYVANTSSTISHFFEKLLKLKDMMHTPAGKREGKVRHMRMCEYLYGFFLEVSAGDEWRQRLEKIR